MDPRFPHDDVEELGRRLTASTALVPGWIPPEVELLNIRGLLISEHVDGSEHVILPGRNIASRMARVGESVRIVLGETASSLIAEVFRKFQALAGIGAEKLLALTLNGEPAEKARSSSAG